jgi:hypothetical protein
MGFHAQWSRRRPTAARRRPPPAAFGQRRGVVLGERALGVLHELDPGHGHGVADGVRRAGLGFVGRVEVGIRLEHRDRLSHFVHELAEVDRPGRLPVAHAAGDHVPALVRHGIGGDRRGAHVLAVAVLDRGRELDLAHRADARGAHGVADRLVAPGALADLQALRLGFVVRRLVPVELFRLRGARVVAVLRRLGAVRLVQLAPVSVHTGRLKITVRMILCGRFTPRPSRVFAEGTPHLRRALRDLPLLDRAVHLLLGDALRVLAQRLVVVGVRPAEHVAARAHDALRRRPAGRTGAALRGVLRVEWPVFLDRRLRRLHDPGHH